MLELDICNRPSTITFPFTIIFMPSSETLTNAPDSITRSPFISIMVCCLTCKVLFDLTVNPPFTFVFLLHSLYELISVSSSHIISYETSSVSVEKASFAVVTTGCDVTTFVVTAVSSVVLATVVVSGASVISVTKAVFDTAVVSITVIVSDTFVVSTTSVVAGSSAASASF